jgi:transposase
MKPGSRLVKQGLSHRAIASQLHMHRESVMRDAKAERFPERPERSAHPGILVPYETYLRARFLEGERNGVGLWRELSARG